MRQSRKRDNCPTKSMQNWIETKYLAFNMGYNAPTVFRINKNRL